MTTQEFSRAARQDTTRKPQMSLHDAYVGSLDAKLDKAARQIKKATTIYDAKKNEDLVKLSKLLATPVERGEDSVSLVAGKQQDALKFFVDAVDKAVKAQGVDRKADPKAFADVVRQSYGQMIATHGVENINLLKQGDDTKYEDWYKVYVKSFPIRGERETKRAMETLLSGPEDADKEKLTIEAQKKKNKKDPIFGQLDDSGYGEIAVGLRDPLTGQYAGGVQGLVVSKAAAGMFTYAFLDPAFQGLGLSRTLLDQTRKTIAAAVKIYNPTDKRDVAVFLEKNNLGKMPLENIFLDSTGIDVLKGLPREGAKLGRGAISQSRRDNTWGNALGAKEVLNAHYIQPSLDDVTRIKDKNQRELAIRYLQEDPKLTERERERAAKLVKDALGSNAEHCPLALCAFVDKKETHLNAQQTIDFLSAFYQTSCLATTPQGLREDIFADATLKNLEAQLKLQGGKLALGEVKPFGGPIQVETFKEAERLTRALLNEITLPELQASARATANGAPEKSYNDWLEQKADVLIQKYGFQRANANTAPQQQVAASKAQQLRVGM